MSVSAFYLVVDARYFPIALGLAKRLVDIWHMDVHIFLEDNSIGRYAENPFPKVHVHTNRLKGLRPQRLPETCKWPAVVYDRIFAPRFLQDYDRLVYLDADIYPVIAAPELLTAPLPGGLGAVQDTALVAHPPAAVNLTRNEWRASIGLREERYFNSGFLLIDPAIWNRIDFAAELEQYVAEYGKGVRMPDQDFLNWRFQGIWTEFSPRYNFQKSIFSYGYDEWFKPVFLHFSSAQKPWLMPNDMCSVQAQFFAPFTAMIREAGVDPTDLQAHHRPSLPRRLRQTVRKRISAYGYVCRKELRLRAEWQTRADTLFERFEDDLLSGRYADMKETALPRPQPNLTFDGQYLQRTLNIMNTEAA